MAHRKLPLAAADRDRVVTLHPKLIISGRVTDAETGQPLPKCLIIQGVGFEGSDQISWSRLAGAEAFGREYASTFDEPSASMFLRVEAIGYQPAVSRAFRSSEGRQTVDFALQRADTISGVVLLPSGKPGDGVDVVFATEAKQVLLEMGRIEARTSAPRSRTGPDGQFAFTATSEKFILFALGDAGYTNASSDEFAKSGKLVLQPWGRLEGEVQIDAQPAAKQEVVFNPGRRGGGIDALIDSYTTRTDDHGRFAFDRVIPGPGSVARQSSPTSVVSRSTRSLGSNPSISGRAAPPTLLIGAQGPSRDRPRRGRRDAGYAYRMDTKLARDHEPPDARSGREDLCVRHRGIES